MRVQSEGGGHNDDGIKLREWLAMNKVTTDRRQGTQSYPARSHHAMDTLSDAQLRWAAQEGVRTSLPVWLPVREYVRGVETMAGSPPTAQGEEKMSR